MAMHDDEVEVPIASVARLIAERMPELRLLPLHRFASAGTMNAIWRLGDQLTVRVPLTPDAGASLEREARWLPIIGPHLPIRVPHVITVGAAHEAFRHPWAVYDWIDGAPFSMMDDAGAEGVATELARFVTALRAIPLLEDAPAAGRRPLPELDGETRDWIARGRGDIDADRALREWEECLEAPLWNGERVWIHSDLLPLNLVVRAGSLVGVIDFGGVGCGDPAMDLIPAWSVFGPRARSRFRAELGGDDGIWLRARGVALHQALALVPYYRESNPVMADLGRSIVERILAD